MLPAKGPRRALKGEAQVTVRLMDDIDVPRPTSSLRSYQRPPAPASYHSQSFRKPVALKNSENPAPQKPADNADTADVSENGYDARNLAPAADSVTNSVVTSEVSAQMILTSSVVTGQASPVRLIALKP